VTPAPIRTGPALVALWSLNFAASAQFLVVTPLLPVIRDQLGVREDLLGLLVTSYAVGVGVMALIGGPLSDRVGRRRILLVGSAWMAIALLLHVVAVDFWILMAVRLVAGCASGLIASASVAYVADALPFDQRGRANGILASGFAAGQILGIPIGTMLGEVGYRLPFVTFGVAVALSWMLLYRYALQPPVPLVRDLSLRESLASYGRMLRRSDTAGAVAAYTVMFFGVSVFITYLPTELVRRFDATPTTVSTLFVVGGIANLIFAPLAGAWSDRYGRKLFVVGGSAAAGATMIATPWLLVDFWVAYLLFFVIMIFVAFRISPMQTLVSSLVAPSLRGRLMALCFAIGQVGFGLGSSLAGPLYQTYGFWSTSVAGGVVAAAMAALTLALIPEPDGDIEEQPAPSPAPEPR
jgi:predicted MFS family arabinose efflux permease